MKFQYYGPLAIQMQEGVREWGHNDITELTETQKKKKPKTEGIQFRNCFCFLTWQLKGIQDTLSLTL